MSEVEIYTDGACTGNPGPGGWAALLRYGPHEKTVTGCAANTTNQRMELAAAIGGLQALKRPCRVRLYSDSAYLINAFQQHWVDRWRRNGWKTAGGHPVENQDLWLALLEAAAPHEVTWVKVRGHADNELNNRCDSLARAAAAQAAAGYSCGGSEAAARPATYPVE